MFSSNLLDAVLQVGPVPGVLHFALVLPIHVLMRELQVPHEVARVELARDVHLARLALAVLRRVGQHLEVVPDHRLRLSVVTDLYDIHSD